jgi:hypothetical protein
MADGAPDHHRISKRVARQLDRDATKLTCDWWETELSSVMSDLARSGGFLVALAGIAQVIQLRRDPLWVVGDTSAASAHQVAWEWLDAGVEPADVGAWLLAGCWNPATAKALADAGVHPDALVDADGAVRFLVETPTGERLPAAHAAADGHLTPADVLAAIEAEAGTDPPADPV